MQQFTPSPYNAEQMQLIQSLMRPAEGQARGAPAPANAAPPQRGAPPASAAGPGFYVPSTMGGDQRGGGGRTPGGRVEQGARAPSQPPPLPVAVAALPPGLPGAAPPLPGQPPAQQPGAPGAPLGGAMQGARPVGPALAPPPGLFFQPPPPGSGMPSVSQMGPGGTPYGPMVGRVGPAEGGGGSGQGEPGAGGSQTFRVSVPLSILQGLQSGLQGPPQQGIVGGMQHGYVPPGQFGGPQYGPPPYGPPQYGPLQYGRPSYGQQPPPYGGPPYGPPQYGSPQYGGPQYGPPQYGPLQYGLPQYAPPNYGQQRSMGPPDAFVQQRTAPPQAPQQQAPQRQQAFPQQQQATPQLQQSPPQQQYFVQPTAERRSSMGASRVADASMLNTSGPAGGTGLSRILDPDEAGGEDVSRREGVLDISAVSTVPAAAAGGEEGGMAEMDERDAVAPTLAVADAVQPVSFRLAAVAAETKRYVTRLARRGQVAGEGETPTVSVLLAPGLVPSPRTAMTAHLYGPMPPPTGEWLCLFRAGKAGTSKFVTARPIPLDPKAAVAKAGGPPFPYYRSEVVGAPRSSGAFEMLAFDSEADNASPCGRSLPFVVSVQGKDVAELLSFTHVGDGSIDPGVKGAAGKSSLLIALIDAGLVNAVQGKEVVADVHAREKRVYPGRDRDPRREREGGKPAAPNPATDGIASGLEGERAPFGLAASFLQLVDRLGGGGQGATAIPLLTPLAMGRIAVALFNASSTLVQVTSIPSSSRFVLASAATEHTRGKGRGERGRAAAASVAAETGGRRAARSSAVLTAAITATGLNGDAPPEEFALPASITSAGSTRSLPDAEISEAVWRIARDAYITALMCSITTAAGAASGTAAITGRVGLGRDAFAALRSSVPDISVLAPKQASLLDAQVTLIGCEWAGARSQELMSDSEASKQTKAPTGPLNDIAARHTTLLAVHAYVRAVLIAVVGTGTSAEVLRACLSPRRARVVDAWLGTWDPVSELFTLGALPPSLLPPAGGVLLDALVALPAACAAAAVSAYSAHVRTADDAADAWLRKDEGPSSTSGEGKGEAAVLARAADSARDNTRDAAQVGPLYAAMHAGEREARRQGEAALLSASPALPLLLSTPPQLLQPATVAALDAELRARAAVLAPTPAAAVAAAKARADLISRLQEALTPLTGLVIAAVRAAAVEGPDDAVAARGVRGPLYPAILKTLTEAQAIALASCAFVSVQAYGSAATGLAGPSSDLDVSVQPKFTRPPSESAPTLEAALGGLTDAEAQEALDASWIPSLVLTSAAGLLRTGLQGATAVSTRLTARTPILMFKDGRTGLAVDLSPSASLALANSALVRTYVAADARVPSLLRLLKDWLSARRLLGAQLQGLSSYALALALIAYLQTPHVAAGSGADSAPLPPLLPCLQGKAPSWPFPTAEAALAALTRTGGSAEGASEDVLPAAYARASDGSPHDVSFWTPEACLAGPVPARKALTSLWTSKCTASLSSLFLGFLWHYSGLGLTSATGLGLDVRTSVVSLRPEAVDGTVPRYDKQVWHGWRSGGGSASNGPQSAGPSSGPPGLAIEDPFEPAFDTAHSLVSASARALRVEAARAYGLATLALGDGGMAAQIDALMRPCGRTAAERLVRAHASEQARKAAKAAEYADAAESAFAEAEAEAIAEQEGQYAMEAAAEAALASYGAGYGGQQAVAGIGGWGYPQQQQLQAPVLRQEEGYGTAYSGINRRVEAPRDAAAQVQQQQQQQGWAGADRAAAQPGLQWAAARGPAADGGRPQAPLPSQGGGQGPRGPQMAEEAGPRRGFGGWAPGWGEPGQGQQQQLQQGQQPSLFGGYGGR